VPTGDQVPPVYRWLAEQIAVPILELPMAFSPGGPQLEYQYLSTYHWHTTPDGYSGFIPPKHGQIAYEMERFPSERSLSLLQALEVRYVVIHTDRYPSTRWNEIEDTLAGVSDLVLVEYFGPDRVYAVRSHPAGPSNLRVRGYFPTYAVASQPFTAYVIAVNHGVRSYAIQPTELLQIDAEWEGSDPRVETVVASDIPMVTSPNGGAAVIPVSLMAPSIAGAYRLSLTGQAGPLGSWSATGQIQVGNQATESFPIPAQLVSWSLAASVRASEELRVELIWRALGKIDAYYSLYVKLIDGEGNAVAGWDGQPLNGQAPTLLWLPGETITDVVHLGIPSDTPPGDYTAEAGMYRATDLSRCLTLNEEGVPLDRILLGTVHVAP
jgi:hypothetical protein